MNREISDHSWWAAWACILLSLLALGSAQAASARDRLQLERKTTLAAGIQRLVLHNRVGTISFQGTQGQKIQIEATIKPANHDGGGNFFGLFSCCSEHFRNEIQGARLRMRPLQDHVLEIALVLPHDPSLKHIKTDWRIEAPEKLGLAIHNNVGTIKIHRMGGRISALTNVGTVTVTAPGASVRAHANVGSIRIEGASHSVMAKTNVGSIDVLSTATSFRLIHLSTNIGSLHIQGAPAVSQTPSSNTIALGGHYRYSGSGQSLIRLKTNIGKILLHIQPSAKPAIHG